MRDWRFLLQLRPPLTCNNRHHASTSTLAPHDSNAPQRHAHNHTFRLRPCLTTAAATTVALATTATSTCMACPALRSSHLARRESR